MQAQGPVPPVTRCRARQQWSAEQRRAPRCCMVTAGCGGRVVECRHRRVARLSALSCPCDGLSMPLPLRHTVHYSAHSAQRSAVRGGGAGWVLQGYVYVDCAALRHALSLSQTGQKLAVAPQRPLCESWALKIYSLIDCLQRSASRVAKDKILPEPLW